MDLQLQLRDVVWLFVLFDLPVVTDAERKRYVRFRRGLLSRGFSMLQWSVYARAYVNLAASGSHARAIAAHVPEGGRVRLLVVTDRQFERMVVCEGESRQAPERPLAQLLLFDK